MNYIRFVNLLVVSLALAFVACDDGNSATQADEPSPSLETELLKLALSCRLAMLWSSPT